MSYEKDKRESVAAIVKGLLGVLAAIIGIPLLIGGLFVAIWAGCIIDPEIAGRSQTYGIATMGGLAAAIGASLCFGAWLALHGTRK